MIDGSRIVQQGNWTGALLAAAALAAQVLMGCNAIDPAPAPDAAGKGGSPAMAALIEPPASRFEVASLTDFSGLVQVKIWAGAVVGPAQRNTATCAPDPGFVLVGGGAEVLGTDAGGGLLTGSEPSRDLLTWRAASKDHLVAWNHKLRAYAVGLRLMRPNGTFLDEATLRGELRLVRTTSAKGSHPFVTSSAPINQVVLGGGAWAMDACADGTNCNDLAWNGAGQLLQASLPNGMGGWTGMSKDHGVADPGFIRVSVISLPLCPKNWGACLEDRSFSVTNRATGSGYRSSFFVLQDVGFVMTGPGAADAGTGAGRLLTDIIPSGSVSAPRGSIFAFSKDHSFVDFGGNMPLAAQGIRLKVGP